MKHVLAEGELSVAEGACGYLGHVVGKIGAKPLVAILREVNDIGIKCGDNVRLAIEKIEPKTVFPTGNGWQEAERSGNCTIADWHDSAGKVAIQCIAYDDGSRAIFFKRSFGQYWQPPFSTELPRAIDWERFSAPFQKGAPDGKQT